MLIAQTFEYQYSVTLQEILSLYTLNLPRCLIFVATGDNNISLFSYLALRYGCYLILWVPMCFCIFKIKTCIKCHFCVCTWSKGSWYVNYLKFRQQPMIQLSAGPWLLIIRWIIGLLVQHTMLTTDMSIPKPLHQMNVCFSSSRESSIRKTCASENYIQWDCRACRGWEWVSAWHSCSFSYIGFGTIQYLWGGGGRW